MLFNRRVTNKWKALVVVLFALLPIGLLTWSGELEWYTRIAGADVRVNDVPAGYLHRGFTSSLVTRTDGPNRHSYRIWQTPHSILIFDCHEWVAPDWRLFGQGNVANPCIYPTTKRRAETPMSPVTQGTVKDGRLYFKTRDGSIVSLRVQIWNRVSMQ